MDEPTSDSVERELSTWLAQMEGADPRVEAARQRIGRLARLFARSLEQVAEDQEMSLGDWEALSVIVRAGGRCTPKELAEALGLTSGTVSVRLERLTRAGLVQAVTHADGRSRPVAVTSQGRKRWREATAARTRAEQELFGVLEPEQQDELNNALRVLLNRYESVFGEASRHDRTDVG
ncbi:MAG: MarR family transcriptional regulator [Solirubrobacterales bacterium]|nr:MarR family transcriptional regulator [Solirubrobacterales bacterium]